MSRDPLSTEQRARRLICRFFGHSWCEWLPGWPERHSYAACHRCGRLWNTRDGVWANFYAAKEFPRE